MKKTETDFILAQHFLFLVIVFNVAVWYIALRTYLCGKKFNISGTQFIKGE